eukprot:4876932-Amphidinium_carterae.3
MDRAKFEKEDRIRVWHKDVDIVWTDGSGRHSSNPRFRRCRVGHVTDTGARVWLLLPSCRQSVFVLNFWPWRAPWKSAVLAGYIVLTKGQRRPIREGIGILKYETCWPSAPLTPAGQLHWIKAHQTQQAVIDCRATMEDFRGNQEADEQEADEVANLGAAEHAVCRLASLGAGCQGPRRSDTLNLASGWTEAS